VVSCKDNEGTVHDVLRARCGPTQDTISESVHSVAFQLSDYRAVLRRRKILAAPLTYTNIDSGQIALDIINVVEAEPNGNYGIVGEASHYLTGDLSDWSVPLGEPVTKTITELSRIDPNFDWDITPAMTLKTWPGSRGEDNGRILEYGRAVSAVTRARTPSDYTNDALLFGAESLTPVRKTIAGIATAPEGRWQETYSFSNIEVQASLDDRGDTVLAAESRIDGSYNMTLTPGFWQGPAHIDLGDIVEFRLDSGRINEVITMKIFEITVDINDDGEEKVRMVGVPS
jgi:hypothetical protein